ncbi:MAG: hypothetical protein U0165_07150 [Polyangiaceae bacterium]
MLLTTHSRLIPVMALLLVSMTLGTSAGCDSSSSKNGNNTPATCPNDLPDSCPSTPPTWDTGVSDVVKSKCASCHTQGGEAAFKPFDTHDEILASRSAALNQVYACKMPPADGASLTEEERATLLQWFVCGSP